MRCVILAFMNDEYSWLQHIKARGLENILSAALDVLEPLGPLGAQAVWLLQPALGIFVSRTALDNIARALEEPDTLERLRSHLED
jgi:hypothetical protein